jgi:1,4-dihydroxy-6-naphthoate synthase
MADSSPPLSAFSDGKGVSIGRTRSKPLTLGHSPDPDDAFLFYALATGKIDSRGWQFEHVLQDIQTLNERALRAELDITAISFHAYPFVAKDYVLTGCGASVGDGYGPLVVARDRLSAPDLTGRTIAIPGERTTAFLVLSLFLGPGTFRHEVVPFDRILDHVAQGRAEAGLIIHEGQLTYAQSRLHKVVDLGQWWKQETGLPLPLGGNSIRRALGPKAIEEITAILKESIQYGLNHREDTVQYAMRFGRGLTRTLTDQFVGMYVNAYTLDYGPTGRRAVEELLRRGRAAGLLPPLPAVEIVDV